MNSFAFSKICNALIPGAIPSYRVPAVALTAIEDIAERFGGLWVGGRMEVEADELVFRPNRLNQALHEGLSEIHIPFREIQAIHREFGWFTGVVVVTHSQGEFRFRCYGAKSAASNLATLLSKASIQ